jgi:hypothetical protein
MDQVLGIALEGPLPEQILPQVTDTSQTITPIVPQSQSPTAHQ